jgi:hypothetical protein
MLSFAGWRLTHNLYETATRKDTTAEEDIKLMTVEGFKS